jgi:hypothetical protein
MAIINGVGRVGVRVTSGGSSGGGTDADAQAFITAASITDPTQISAVNTLVTGLKSNNLWSKMKAIYPVVGGNATAHSKNLKNPSQYQLSFSSGWVHSSTGMQGNGTSAYASLGYTQSEFMVPGSGHMAIYSRTQTTAGGRIEMGNYAGAGYTILQITDNMKCTINASNMLFGNSNTDGRGFYIGSRISSTSNLQSKNATQYTSSYSEAFSVGNIVIGAVGTMGAPQLYSTKQYALASIGLGLNSSEMTIYNTLVQAFQTTLGRQV